MQAKLGEPAEKWMYPGTLLLHFPIWAGAGSYYVSSFTNGSE